MLEKIRAYFVGGSMAFYSALFMAVYLMAWAANGIYGTRFDLDRLRDIYVWLMTQLNATHAINSVWNSPNGQKPG
jgi:hypothetical protein